jgi:hypothetical protein
VPGISDGRLWAAAQFVPFAASLSPESDMRYRRICILLFQERPAPHIPTYLQAFVPVSHSDSATRFTEEFNSPKYFGYGTRSPAVLVLVTQALLGSLLAARTMGYTSISSLQYKLGPDSLPSLAATEVAQIHHKDAGGRPAVDVRLFDTISGPAAFIINDEGTVFQSNVTSNTNATCVFCLLNDFTFSGSV